MQRERLKAKSEEIFSGLAGSYDLALDFATVFQDRSWKDWVIRRLNIADGGPVLDIGCGTLLLEARMAKLGTKFLGVDLSPEMVRVAREKKAANVVLLANADAEHLPFPDGSFGTVVSCYVPKYVTPRRFAEEVARVTRPGGEVLLYDFALPRGAAAPVLRAYIEAGLPVVGRALRLAGRPEAVTFTELPRIIGGTRWDAEVPMEMGRCGFETVETARLTGGTVFAYRGKRR